MHEKKPGKESEVPRILLDTNVLISALLFGGRPREALLSALRGDYVAVASPVLLEELTRVLKTKFAFPDAAIALLLSQIEKSCITVTPSAKLKIMKDAADNRVLEAAVVGKCAFIITGDKELLALERYRGTKIIDTYAFLKYHRESHNPRPTSGGDYG